jgi:DNA polymerase-3 subunit delta'
MAKARSTRPKPSEAAASDAGEQSVFRWTFDSILGHESAISELKAAMASDRMAHGILFCGPEGVGKGLCARVLSAWFLCERPGNHGACASCGACKLVETDAHPDFHRVYRALIRLSKDSKARDLAVEVIRDFLNEPAARTSVLGLGKVFIVEEADLMNAAAQNALLKTLEEPHGRTLIILLAEQLTALFPTIRSRVRVFRFGELPRSVIEAELVRAGVDPSRASSAARWAGGSLGRALRWSREGMLDPVVGLVELLQRAAAGRNVVAELQSHLRKSAEEYAKQRVAQDKLGSEDQFKREGLESMLRVVAEVQRELLRSGGDHGAMLRACDAVDAVRRAEELTDSNVGVPLVAYDLAIGVAGGSAE